MDVDRTNFEEGLAALRSALKVGDFYALDCEFTGIDTTSSNGGGGGRGGGRGGGNLPPFRPPECGALQPPTFIDEPEERFPALASAASRFAVAQVGIAVFEWVRSGAGGGTYKAHPFNCWTFVCSPSSASSSTSSSAADAAAAFQCTPGSLAFLSGAGFDFNRWIGKGIPSFSARERDELLAREEARKGGGGGGGAGGGGGGSSGGGDEAKKDRQQFQRPPIVPTAPHDVALVEETVSRVSEWLLPSSSEGEQEGGEKRPSQSHFLRLRGGNAFQRALVYQTLERGDALAPLRFHPGTEDAHFVSKTLWPDEEEAFFSEVAAAEAAAEAGEEDRAEATIRQNPEPSSLSAAPEVTAPAAVPSPPSPLPPPQQQQQQRPRRADIVLLRVPPGGARLAAERERSLRLERARLGSGFALFLEALRDSGLPCAVHNGAGDLAHVVASFGEGPAALLPPRGSSFAGFGAAVARWFPGGVFDTKVLASRAFLRGDPFGNATALRDLYEGLVAGGVGGAKGANGTTAAAGAPTTETPTPPPFPLPRVPRPSLPASGPFSRYAAALRSGGSSIDGLEHEAGFDALLTGAALWGLANALGEGGQGEGNDDGSDDDDGGDGIGGGGGNNNNNRRRSSFPTSLPPPPLLKRPKMQRDPSPRDLVASIEAAAAASDEGGSGASAALWLRSSPPPRRVRASRLPRAALGCVYAHMSDWGVLPLMEEAKRKKWGGEAAALFPPPRRDNVLFVVPLSPLLGGGGGGGGNEDGGGGGYDVFRALHSLASREAEAGRCRVTPRLRGWAASLELFEAGMPPPQRPQQQQQQPNGDGGGEQAPRPRRTVDPAEVARALASLPQLRGCRVLDYGAFREWKQRAISRAAAEEARPFVDEERAAAEAAAEERAALAAALGKDAAAGVFGRRRAAPADGDAAFPRKRSRGGEGGEGGGGGGGGGGTRACVIQ